MAKFYVRVELHGAKHGDDSYDVLHKAMEDARFKRTLTANGTTYKLPTAEYRLVASKTKKQVFDMANEAAGKTHKTSAILVIQSAGTHFRLDEKK